VPLKKINVTGDVIQGQTDQISE